MPTDPAPAPDHDFDALDLCHRATLIALGRLAALVHRLQTRGADDEVRSLAREVTGHFAQTVRQHHADEERLVFPELITTGDQQTIKQVLRLQQDHCWLEEDWMEMQPHLEALAAGQSWWDLDGLKAAAEVFSALSLDHIALEESIIYPQARERLAERNRREPGRVLATQQRATRGTRQLP